MPSFSLSVKKFVATTKERQDLFVRKLGMDMSARIILRSPVGNPDLWKGKAPKGYVGGQFRANWQVAFNTPPTGTINAKDKSGSKTIAKANATLSMAMAGTVIWIVNNLPYARALEYGWSTQAPAGMVRVTVKEFRFIVNKAAAEAKRERA